MTSVFNIEEQTMKCVMKWHRLGQFFSVCSYLAALTVLFLFFVHTSNPEVASSQTIMNAIFYTACTFIGVRVVVALITKHQIGKWERSTNHKLSNRDIIQLL